MSVDVQRPRCPYCHEDVVPGEGMGCSECMGWAHGECWDAHGMCPACGASKPLVSPAPEPEAKAAEASSLRLLFAILVAALVGTIATLVVRVVWQ